MARCGSRNGVEKITTHVFHREEHNNEKKGKVNCIIRFCYIIHQYPFYVQKINYDLEGHANSEGR